MNWGVSAAMHAAREMALETMVPGEAEEETYPRSAVEEASLELAEPFDVFLPQRCPAIPSPTAPRDDTRRDDTRRDDIWRDDIWRDETRRDEPRRTGFTGPPPAQHRPPDLAVLDQVLRGLQRMA